MGIIRNATYWQSRQVTRLMSLDIDRLQVVIVPDRDLKLAGPSVERPDADPQVGATRLDHVPPGAVFLQMRPKNSLDRHVVFEFQDLLGGRFICHLLSFGLVLSIIRVDTRLIYYSIVSFRRECRYLSMVQKLCLRE
jgi:hypothetical protein